MYIKNFINDCLYGDAELDELDDYVEYWHTHETSVSLREFLGLTKYEYELLITSGNEILRDILRCRADGIPFEDYEYMSDNDKIAARSYSIEEIEKLKNDDKHGNQ